MATGSDIAGVLGSVFERANEQVREKSEESQKQRNQEIDFYYRVMLNPDTPASKAEDAAKEIAKLQQVKFPKGANPLEMVTGLLNTFRGMRGKKQMTPLQGGQPPQAGGKTTNLTGAGQDTLQPQSNVRQIGGKSYPGQLPPLNTGVLATPEDTGGAEKRRAQASHSNEMAQYKKDLHEAAPNLTEEQLDKAVETKFGAIPKATASGHAFTKKGTVYGKEIPEGEKDILGNPIDKEKPYDVLQNAAGDKEYVTAQQTPTVVDTATTDPAGQTTHTHTVRKRGLSPLQPSDGKGEGKGPKKTLTPLKSTANASNGHPSAASAGQSTGQLDENSHIPRSATVNPQLRSAANQLIDGMSMKDLQLPQKDKQAAADLVEAYIPGWSQGKFTPRELTMVTEGSAFIDKLANSPSLKVLDQGFLVSGKLGQRLMNPDKEGKIDRGLTTLASKMGTPEEDEFVALYNEAAQTIAGLAPLIRVGRMTQAQFDRLRADLPHPATTHNSTDARRRLALLQEEIKIALRRQSFMGTKSNVGQWGENPYKPKAK